jgi:hypothetical protein
MTLEELENTLPNGLHDSEIGSIEIDYIQRSAAVKLSVFVGELNAPPESHEAYREASLVISGLQYLTIEPPHENCPFAESKALWIDACDMSKNLNSNLLASLPKGSFVRSFFVNQWNSFVHLAGIAAELIWNGPTVYRKEREHYLPGETVDL